uniref:Calx-beta domain-containing protein n=1 Tax=Alexandrium monilatum TaxID=311494 RepID=A0A7S4QGX4_9DINO
MVIICEGGVPLILGGNDGGIFLPLCGDSEANWPRWVKIIIYMIGLLWCFDGVGLIADKFMGAIEKITSQKRRVKRGDKEVTVKVWNATVANLTLMALGSSAPEILLSLIELTITEKWNSGQLGPSTIVGSAAFNLFVITAVCVSALPDGEVRKIKDLSVFMVTAFFSLFAYLWLLVILVLITPDVVTVAEGVITFLFAPLLVILAYLADKGYFQRICSKLGYSRLVLSENTTPEEYTKMVGQLRAKYGRMPSDQHDRDALVYYEFSPPISRAAHRVQATRAMSGGTQVMASMERFLRGKAVSARMKSEAKTGAGSCADALVSFVSSHYAVTEEEKKVKVSVKIQRFGGHQEPVSVKYKSRDGTANKNEDYEEVNGFLTFEPGQDDVQSFEVQITQDSKAEPTEEFYVDLKIAQVSAENAHIGAQKTATIVVLDSDGAGELKFESEEVRIAESEEKVLCPVVVKRGRGATGKVTCKYRTEDGSAKAGKDYTETSGTLEFAEGSQSARFNVEILPKGKYESTESFRIILEEATGGAFFATDTDGGKECNIMTVVIEADNKRHHTHWESFMMKFNFDELEIGSANWKDQFKEAIYVAGSREEQAASSWTDMVLHVISLPWKLIFACVPPTDYVGGWFCFIVSLVMIGLLTAVIGDMANLLGCAMDMKAPICAVTIVALGTSLPDTFASQTAAQQDTTADNSIGNVTGSNSVNVFLGLGLPWMIGAIYWAVEGAKPGSEWYERYPELVQRYPQGGFIVKSDGLGLSVGVFSGCCVLCLGILALRRQVYGAELGGPTSAKWATAFVFVLFWVVYVSISIVFSPN